MISCGLLPLTGLMYRLCHSNITIIINSFILKKKANKNKQKRTDRWVYYKSRRMS